MNHTCKCGGRVRPIDILEPVIIDGRECYKDVRIKPGFASFQCDRCGKRAEQKLRVSKKGTPV